MRRRTFGALRGRNLVAAPDVPITSEFVPQRVIGDGYRATHTHGNLVRSAAAAIVLSADHRVWSSGRRPPCGGPPVPPRRRPEARGLVRGWRPVALPRTVESRTARRRRCHRMPGPGDRRHALPPRFGQPCSGTADVRAPPRYPGGNRTVTDVPRPSSVRTAMSAPCASAIHLAMDSPSPAPSVRLLASRPRKNRS